MPNDDVLKGLPVNAKGFGIISKLAMQDRRLHVTAKAIYAYFNSFAGSGDTCFPTREKICYDLGISKESFAKYLRQLTNIGYIQVEQIKDNGRFSHNTYTICGEVSPCTELPCTELPCTELPCTELPCTVKPPTNNNNINNNNLNNNSLNNTSSSTSTFSTKSNKVCPLTTIRKLFTEICVSYPAIRSIDGSREKAVEARWKNNPDIEIFKELFTLAENSSFLKGNNDRNWRANFDWLMNANNFNKVLEHRYDDKKAKSQSDGHNDDLDFIFGGGDNR